MLFISETLPESGQKFWTSKKKPGVRDTKGSMTQKQRYEQPISS